MEQLGLGVGGQEKDNPHIFLVGATRQRLLSGAEEVGLFKEYNDGSMRGFTCANKHNFTEFRGKRRRLFSLSLSADSFCVWPKLSHFTNACTFKLRKRCIVVGWGERKA